MRLLAAGLLASSIVLAPQAAVAQRGAPDVRSRLWYEVTVGGAGARLTCGICTPDRDVGAAVSGAIGAYAGRRVRVGLELSRWTYRDDDVREQISGLGVVAHLVPDPARGFFLVGGAGWAGYRAGDFKYDAPRLSVGAGYDIPAFGKFVVGNQVTLDVSAFGALRSGSATVLDNVGLSSVRAAVQLRRR